MNNSRKQCLEILFGRKVFQCYGCDKFFRKEKREESFLKYKEVKILKSLKEKYGEIISHGICEKCAKTRYNFDKKKAFLKRMEEIGRKKKQKKKRFKEKYEY